MGEPDVDHRQELLRAFGIGPDDLAANRAGRLGTDQARLLRRSATRNLVGGGVICAGLLVVLYLVADKPLRPVQWILAAILVAAALASAGVEFRRLRTAAEGATVECVTGLVQVRLRGRAGWYADVDQRSFKLPVAFWHLPVEAPYRVYVAPGVNRIVAMEPDGWA